MATYKEKYIKYKNKYLELKEQIGGTIMLCPYCNTRIYHTKALEHIEMIHNIPLTKEQLQIILKQRENSNKKLGGKYNVKCEYCNNIFTGIGSLSYHMFIKHYDNITYDNFNFIDNNVFTRDLGKNHKNRIKFVELEIKFNKIQYSPDMDKEQLANIDEIEARRRSRVTKTKRQRRTFPLQDTELLDLETLATRVAPAAPLSDDSSFPPAAPLLDDESFPTAAPLLDDESFPTAAPLLDDESFQLGGPLLDEEWDDDNAIDEQFDFFSDPDLYLSPSNAQAAPTTFNASSALVASDDDSSHSFLQDTYSDILIFDLKSIPFVLLFNEEKDELKFESNLYKCVYCGLEFNRYYLAKHLLDKHSMIITLIDLNFIKTVVLSNTNDELDNEVKKHIIAKIKTKILQRDELLLPILTFPVAPAASAASAAQAAPVAPAALPYQVEPVLSELDLHRSRYNDFDDLFLTETPYDL